MKHPIQMPISDDDLHGYVDGQLSEARRAAVEAHLAADPAAAKMVAEWRAQNAILKRAYSRVRPMPLRAQGLPFWKRVPAAAAVAAIAFCAGLALGMFAAPWQQTQPVVAASLAAWSETNYLVYASDVRHPVEVGKAEKDHLLQWLSKRFGGEISAPDLSVQGFDLIGGRLVSYQGKPAALLMYENASGERVTLAIGRNRENSETGFLSEEKDGLRTFHWMDGPVGYGVSGRIEREKLSALSKAIYDQL